ncbi:MAG: malate dehydrogenase [Candidatus Micrarchaeales archaeon]
MRKKVSIIGAGRVGSTTAQILAYKGICDIVLLDRIKERAMGIALDIEQSAPIEGFDAKIKGTGSYSDIEDSDIVIVTAGVPRKEGMSRDDLLKINAEIIKNVCGNIKKYAPNCILIVLTNPLDAMVYIAKKVTGFPKQRIIGMAGILDSSRFSEFIAMELNVSVDDVAALVLGGHGDFMVPLPRYTSVSGIPVSELIHKARLQKLIERTVNAGAEIIKLEKDTSAFYAPASSLVAMVEAILGDKKKILPCAAYLDGEYGLKGIFMGVPVVIGGKGIEKIIELDLTKEEKQAVRTSGEKIGALVKGL